MNKVAVGIDIGGTNTYIGFVDEEGEILSKSHLVTGEYRMISDFISAISAKIKEEINKLSLDSIQGIGIGAPNGNFYNGTIESAPNIPWKGMVPLVKLFSNFFPKTPIYVTNDANAAALGEMTYGEVKDLKDFVVVTLGTGVGSGFVVNGEIMYGHDGLAGELGHTIIEENGRFCGCGRRGCMETYASATGFLKTTKEYLKSFPGESILKLKPLSELTAEDVSIAAKNYDGLAINIFDYTAKKLAFSLANMIAITSPQEIILFGGLANAGDQLIRPTLNYLENYTLNVFKGKVKLSTSTLNNNHAAILGASALVWQELKKMN